MGIVLNNIEKKFLNYLIDKYESSVSFIGTNKTNQSFSVKPEKLFKKYTDDSDFETFKSVNISLDELETLDFIFAKKERNGVVKNITLNTKNLIEMYVLLGREQKKDRNKWLLEIFEEFSNNNSVILSTFCEKQKSNIAENNKIDFFDDSQDDFRNVLEAVLFAEQNLRNFQTECFIRDASIKLFNNSKRLEFLAQKVQSLMFKYGNFESKDHVFEECGIVPTPTYVMVKGAIVLEFSHQKIDVSQIIGDIALSTKTLQDLQSVKISGKKLITIENLTSFHDFSDTDACCIYLGGFHNKAKREFLKKVYSQNPFVEYYHFGDIDAGGFYIFEHLKSKTGIPFNMLCMNIETLQKHKENWISLTQNDIIRLVKLQTERSDYAEIIDFMVSNNCKLEQECVAGFL